MKTQRLLRVALALVLVCALLPASAQANQTAQTSEAETLLAQMSPAEKVGQLFWLPLGERYRPKL